MGRQWLNRMSLHLNSVWKVWTRASGRGPFLYDKKYRFDDIFLFYLMYTLYNAVLTITIFFQRIYTMGLKISLSDTAKAVIVCILENVFFRLFLDGVRVMAFIGYGKRKSQCRAASRESSRKASDM